MELISLNNILYSLKKTKSFLFWQAEESIKENNFFLQNNFIAVDITKIETSAVTKNNIQKYKSTILEYANINWSNPILKNIVIKYPILATQNISNKFLISNMLKILSNKNLYGTIIGKNNNGVIFRILGIQILIPTNQFVQMLRINFYSNFSNNKDDKNIKTIITNFYYFAKIILKKLNKKLFFNFKIAIAKLVVYNQMKPKSKKIAALNNIYKLNFDDKIKKLKRKKKFFLAYKLISENEERIDRRKKRMFFIKKSGSISLLFNYAQAINFG